MNPTGSNEPKYPVGKLAVGESLVIPWKVDAQGRRTDQKVLHVTIWRYAKKAGIRVWLKGEHAGLRVTRTA